MGLMDGKNTHTSISRNIGALNRALGHKRGTPRITLDTATTAQRPLILALEALREARQYRLNLDSACARAEILMESAGMQMSGEAQRGETWR